MTGNIDYVSRFQMIKSHLCFTIFEKGLEGRNQVGLCDLFADSSLGYTTILFRMYSIIYMYHEHDEYLQFCEFVRDHVAHSPGLILSTLSQGRHHLWNLVKKMLNINTSANLVPNANRKRDLPAVPRLQSGEVRQWRHKPPQPEASQSPDQQAISSIPF